MSFTARKRLFAWLGLAAMWLAICMPAVSQVIAAHRAEQARVLDVAFCTVDGLTPATALAPSTQAHDAHDRHGASMSHAAHADQGDVCGYCSLLANHPPLVMPALAGAVSFAWIARAGPGIETRPTNTALAFTPPARAPPAVS
ncbi:DUF2946 domain-containing protein [Pandoraea fibrosis]|uniref:DUF2946 domain-containing protein n=1 Tax=Pandoraea fibrosis TaxID=1891094 RepID=A0A5E4S8B3_9BURK|nr:DUF2946 domain-containing protein [Pandoraea fibrosis]VVD71535.1 hypothetical protein PFI31113_00633 [Pandoraea fibrosis]